MTFRCGWALSSYWQAARADNNLLLLGTVMFHLLGALGGKMRRLSQGEAGLQVGRYRDKSGNRI